MLISKGQYKNIIWQLTEEGVLTISGKGDMPDWESQTFTQRPVTPWYRSGCNEKIKKVIIEEGIASVGAEAFHGCINLEKVVLPKSVTMIKSHAFHKCYSLKNINMENIVSIGDYAFSCCDSLEHIDLSDLLETIEDGAFYVSGLKHIDIPANVEIINLYSLSDCGNLEEINVNNASVEIDGGFYGCTSLKRINASDENEYVKSVDGVLYSKDGNTLICYPEDKQDKFFIIPQEVTEIRGSAFYQNKHLEEVHIHSDINNSYMSFYACISLERIVVSEDNPYYSSEDGVLFNKDKTSLLQYPGNKKGDYTVPDTVTEIMCSAFDCCRGLKELYVPKSVEDMHYYTRCSSLEGVYVSKDNEFFTSIDGVLFDKDCTKLIYYPDNKPDKHYVIPSSVKYVGRRAFTGNHNIETMFISENVMNFEEMVSSLEDCPKLRDVEVDKNNKMYSSVDGVVFSKSRAKMFMYPPAKEGDCYVVPDFVRGIMFRVFYDNKNLKKVVLPKDLVEMDIYAVDECENLEEIVSSNDTFVFDNGTLWDMFKHRVIYDKKYDYYQVWKVWVSQNYSLHLQEEWKGISYALSDDGTLTVSGNGMIPQCFIETLWHKDNSIQEKIKKIVIEEGISKIGDWAFEGCIELLEVILPSGMERIESNAFVGCVSLQKIDLNSDLRHIGKYAFKGCAALKTIDIPSSVQVIDDGAFAECKSIVEINIPQETRHIPDWYYGCDSLESINVSEDNDQYASDDGVLYNKAKTCLIWYPDNKKNKTFSIPSSVTDVEHMNNNHLRHLYISENVKFSEIFIFPTSLEHIEVSNDNENYTSIDGVVFDKRCKHLICYPGGRKAERYEILPTVTSIDKEAFHNPYIKTVFVPASVKHIDFNAFRFAKSLENIELDKNIKGFEIKDGKLIDCKDRLTLWDPNEEVCCD